MRDTNERVGRYRRLGSNWLVIFTIVAVMVALLPLGATGEEPVPATEPAAEEPAAEEPAVAEEEAIVEEVTLDPTMWTTDAAGNPVYDFHPGTTVYIHGSGFALDTTYDIPITRPDGSIIKGDGNFDPADHSYVCPDGASSCWDATITDAHGNLYYEYILDGIEGLYYINVFDHPWGGPGSTDELVATLEFSDSHVATHTVVDDVDGADDQPGQKDLTKFEVDTGAGNPIDVSWNWDEIGWPGKNTGDACALFDTDANGLADFAVCVTVGDNPATQTGVSPRLYSCNDTRADRCAGDTLLTFNTTAPITTCSASVVALADPFHAGEDDTVAACSIDVNDVGSGTLIDVCSYPSQQPNSDPSDCVVAGTTAPAVADLALDKSVNNATPNVGDNVVFTIVVTNGGPSDATGVTVDDDLPSGYAYVSDDGGGAYVSGTGIWTIGNLANGASATLNITAQVLATGDYANYAQVETSDQDDPDSTPGDDSVGDDDDDTQATTPTTPPPPPPPSVPRGSIGDFVWLDLDRDGIQDAGEPGVAGVTVILRNGSTLLLRTTTTDTNGFYLFTNVPEGNYFIEVVPPEGMTLTLQDQGTDDTKDSDFDPATGLTGLIEFVIDNSEGQQRALVVVPAAAPVNLTFDAGLVGPPPIVPQVAASAIIGDTVFLDTNGNGIQDPGESGIAGVTVILTNTVTGVTITTVTNANGLYLFAALSAGTYTVHVNLSTLPAGVAATTPASVSVNLAEAASFLDADFGFDNVETLPVTGAETERLAWMAVLMLALGALMITTTKRRYQEGFVGIETIPIVPALRVLSVEGLQTIPGIGPALASKIVAAQNDLTTIDDLLAIPGLGKTRAAKLRDYLTR